MSSATMVQKCCTSWFLLETICYTVNHTKNKGKNHSIKQNLCQHRTGDLQCSHSSFDTLATPSHPWAPLCKPRRTVQPWPWFFAAKLIRPTFWACFLAMVSGTWYVVTKNPGYKSPVNMINTRYIENIRKRQTMQNMYLHTKRRLWTKRRV